MHLANTRIRTEWGPRQRSIARARASFNASLPRRGGRVATQIRRCLTAHDGIASMAQLRSWAYVGQPRQHWHYKWIYAALRRLGARRIGWGIYATRARHSK
jgi:hypothetical protein